MGGEVRLPLDKGIGGRCVGEGDVEPLEYRHQSRESIYSFRWMASAVRGQCQFSLHKTIPSFARVVPTEYGIRDRERHSLFPTPVAIDIELDNLGQVPEFLSLSETPGDVKPSPQLP